MMTIFFIIVCLLSTQILADLNVGMSETLRDRLPYFVNFESDSGTSLRSYECDIISTICALINENCTIVPLPNLNDRIRALENGDIDVSIGLISVTPERAERVHFVRPYYYHTGAQIFVPSAISSDEHPTWSDLQGKKLCTQKGFYAIDAIKQLYNPNSIVQVGTNANNILNGLCDYIVGENTVVDDNLVASSRAQPEFGAPYAIAVPQEEEDGLGAEISDALVQIMRQNLLLLFEAENLVAVGLSLNQKLFDMEMAVIREGNILSEDEENAIWNP